MGIVLANEVSESWEKTSSWKDLLYQVFCADTHNSSKGKLSDAEVDRLFHKILIPVIHESVAYKLKGNLISGVKLCHLSTKAYITLMSLYSDLFKVRVLCSDFDEDCIFCEVIFNVSILENTDGLAFSDFLDTLKDYVNSLKEVSFELLKTLNKDYDYTDALDPWVRENIIPDYMFYLLCDRNYFKHKLSAEYSFDSLMSLLSGFDDIRVLQIPDNGVIVKIGVESK